MKKLTNYFFVYLHSNTTKLLYLLAKWTFKWWRIIFFGIHVPFVICNFSIFAMIPQCAYITINQVLSTSVISITHNTVFLLLLLFSQFSFSLSLSITLSLSFSAFWGRLWLPLILFCIVLSDSCGSASLVGNSALSAYP